MSQQIKVSVKCESKNAFILDIVQSMKMSELSQFLMNSHILHWSHRQNKALKSIGLKSSSNQLLIDYMLMSSTTVGEVYQIYQYFKAKEKHENSYLKEKQFQRNQKEEIMPIVICYEQDYKKSEEKGTLQFRFFRQSDQPFIDKNVQKNYISFENYIIFAGQKPKLIKSVLKSQLDSFQQVKKILFIKKRLIQNNYQFHRTFGQLQQVNQQESKINFCFRYVPSVSFSQILHLQFSIGIIESLANKIWLLLQHLKHYNLQGYMHRLYKSRSLKILFDKLRICINNRLIIDDLSILLEEGGDGSFNQEEKLDLATEIKIYLKLNKSHVDKYQNRLEVEGKNRFQQISNFTFSKIFLMQKYSFESVWKVDYHSKIDCFTWKRESSELEHKKQSNINEATTAKKPRQTEAKSKKKTKLSPNCSITKGSLSKKPKKYK